MNTSQAKRAAATAWLVSALVIIAIWYRQPLADALATARGR